MIEFHQILYMHSYWQDLHWDLHIIFRMFEPELWPFIYVKILFLFNILRKNGHTKFIYEFILTRSSLGLLHIIFRTFVPELWPLIYAKILFPSISCEQLDRISPNLYMHSF